MVMHEEYRHKDGNHRELEELYNRLCLTSEQLTPRAVMKVIIQTLGGSRISIPTLKYIERVERDKKIRSVFHGGNYRELAVRFGLTENSIRRIVHGK